MLIRFLFLLLFSILLNSFAVAKDNISYTKLSQQFRHDELIVSNYPESIKTPGLVLDKTLTASAIRLMYHHRNAMEYPIYMNVLVSNWGLDVATVNVMTGLGGSSKDIVFAGHTSMSKFMISLKNGGKDIVLAPGESARLLSHKIKPDQTVSGLFRVQRGDSDLINLKIQVFDIRYPALSGGIDVPSVLNRFKYGEFENSFVEKKYQYKFETLNKIMSVGDVPFVKDNRTGLEMKGNYGVMYFLTLKVTNPSSENKGITLFLSPVKNQSIDRGVVLLDGELIETDILTYKNNIKIMQALKSYTLRPSEVREIKLMMMPQAGVFYPVDIIVRQTY
ncbi:hypothetical protein DID80_02510 [Candidatus Marinamargulisbacteria bacterium SCGC AAA071-K20]|nr:hypothetical protein DID80_02510 [Candidatus Marinamargulisbacteria bacterium SCGC AAA071-K20]